MPLLEGIGVLLVIGLLLLGALFVRRLLLARTGVVEVSLRLYRGQSGRGWALGLGRFAGDSLYWYRLFSLSFRPSRVLPRAGLTVVRQREPSNRETIALLTGSVVLECTTASGPVELAIARRALTGFRSWLESAAPGTGSTYAA